MRLLAKIDTKSEYVIKGVQLEGVQKIGKINDILNFLTTKNIREFCITDTLASLYMRNNLISIISEATSEFRYPICAGGGIKSIDDAVALIEAGSDRVVINSHAQTNPAIIDTLTNKLGFSCVVSHIDVRKLDGEFHIFTHCGREMSTYKLIDWLHFLEIHKVGELLVTSIDRDGTMKGVDWELIEYLERNSSTPYIYSGGLENIAKLDDFNTLNAMSGLAVMTCMIQTETF